MASDGIGASVRRKEDYRFITGGGSYTDDIDRPGPGLRLLRPLAARPRQDQRHRQERRPRRRPACSRC